MRARFAGIMALLLTFAVSGCGAKNSEKVIGVWRSAERERGRYTFVEIAKDTITIGGKSGDVVLEDRDGKVSVRMAGRDDIVAVITIVDDANISLEFSGMMQQTLKLVKSSKEEQNAAENPPVENILGFWRSSEGDPAQGGVSIVEITPNSITVDGQKRDVTITTENGVYFLASGEAKGSVMINDETSATIVFPGALGDFIKSTPEEIAAFAEAEKAALQQYFGVWRSERFDSTINGYEVVELGDGYITRGNQKIEATLDITKLGLVVTAGGNETTITLKDSNTAVFSERVIGYTDNRKVRGSVVYTSGAKLAAGLPNSSGNMSASGCLAAQAGDEVVATITDTAHFGNQYLGVHWLDATVIRIGFSTILPPNSVNCSELDSTSSVREHSRAIVSPSSYHPGGVQVGLGDGSVRFVSNTVAASRTQDYCTSSGPSPFGVWGALGTASGGESTSL